MYVTTSPISFYGLLNFQEGCGLFWIFAPKQTAAERLFSKKVEPQKNNKKERLPRPLRGFAMTEKELSLRGSAVKAETKQSQYLKQMLKFFKKNKGFTLIELLVVIAIIAVLASIVLVSLNTARVKGRDARRIADIKSIQIALELFYDKNGRYPGATDTTEDTSAEALAMLVSGGFIPAIPADPSGGAYRYAWETNTTIALGGASKYHLAAILEQKGHSVAAADADKLTAFATGGDDIDGATVTCLTGGTAATGVNEVCYDVIP